MNYTEFIKPELMVLVVALYAIGIMIKKTEKIKDNFIPLILTAIGIVLSCIYVLSTEGVTTMSVFTSIVQGILCAAGAVYSNQLFKQASKE